METLILPPLTDRRKVPTLPSARQLSIIGGSGAGKSRFLEELVRLNDKRAYCLSAVSAPYPEREESTRPGSIDMLFRSYASNRSYMRTDAVSELDKLIYMIFTDEFEYLLNLKKDKIFTDGHVKLKKTRLDRLAELWEKVFPGNHIVRTKGSMMFSTSSGNDLITAEKLSQGEQTVLYYAAAVLYAMPNAVITVDSPSLFLHPSILNNLWNSIEELRPDCTFVYNSVDVGFVSSRTKNVVVWVKGYDARTRSWDYDVLNPGELHEGVFLDLIGSRRPILFIEGDATHSIDARLYPLVFPDWTVRPLGSCDKVIETTRTFNYLKNMHNLESRGIVDRDRRTSKEVSYLRKKDILVPDVAEIENIFMLEGVVKPMASRRGKNPSRVFAEVSKKVIDTFSAHASEQALQHVRHMMKREVECRIDGKFKCITALETHINGLTAILQPREKYNQLMDSFHKMIKTRDYASILRVFNHKPMLSECGIVKALNYKSTDDYIAGVLSVLKEESKWADEIRKNIRACFVHDSSEEGNNARKENVLPNKNEIISNKNEMINKDGMLSVRKKKRRKKRKKVSASV